MKEDIHLYKGRCSTLHRDVQQSNTAMTKLNDDAGSLDVQLSHFKMRIEQLEAELVQVTKEKTDQFYEVRRLQE